MCRYEANCIKDIVGKISSILSPQITNISEDFVGIKSRVQDFTSKLKIGSGGVRMVGIWGVGGGGKTTLASVTYSEISHQFDAHCFLQNIRDKSSKYGLEKLQKELLSLVLKEKQKVEGSEIERKNKIKRRWRLSDAMRVLDACSFHPGIGVKVLEKKSLIKVTNGIIDMHDLIEEMAHYIVREEHPNHPERHSRIWQVIDIDQICAKGSGTLKENNHIEVLALPSYTSSLSSDVIDTRLPDVVANMKKVRYIYWDGYPSSSFPVNFEPTKLGCLMLKRGLQVQLWQGKKLLPNLKILDLCGSSFLKCTPDFSGIPCLERLILDYCKSLVRIDSSIGYHERLVYVRMHGCSKLKKFPSIMRMEKLETLILSLCCNSISSKLPQLPRFLRMLDLSSCGLGDGDLPFDMSGLLNLQVLYLCGNKFSRLDSRLSRIPCVKHLNLSWCTKLVELPDLPSSIAILQAENCYSLQSVGDLSCYKSLWKVSLQRRDKLIGGERLLHSMLQVNAFEDRFMSIRLPCEPFETSTFSNTRRLITLQLPHNWYIDFSGFLFFADNNTRWPMGSCIIVIRQEMSMNSQLDHDQWETFDKHKESYEHSLVGYVPFSSLRRTPCWNSASYTNVTFEIDGHNLANPKIGLVPKRSVIGECSEFWDEGNVYGKTFETIVDPKSTNVQIEVAQQGPPLDPETLALSQHEWLQFEPQSAVWTRCRRILRISVPTPRCIDWGLLADAGEAVRARAILGEDTPWTRLFDLADLPTYRLITVEFLSTFRCRAHQAAVREEDDEELPPDIEFSLCGHHFEMSIERFAVHLGIYYEPETVRDDFAQGLTQGEEGVMRAWWSQRHLLIGNPSDEDTSDDHQGQIFFRTTIFISHFRCIISSKIVVTSQEPKSVISIVKR
ncbi:hypothetical protein E3N88_37428 [Mikania micrantha]|uniref:NB-ARC domain-containing protein n=1 Tax=Mikania micrantha TaxID=192012 RepID=A0A5N6LR63_9ASTR|nr:hypothetical protein E3N88_37428 [Mikania micrantha]